MALTFIFLRYFIKVNYIPNCPPLLYTFLPFFFIASFANTTLLLEHQTFQPTKVYHTSQQAYSKSVQKSDILLAPNYYSQLFTILHDTSFLNLLESIQYSLRYSYLIYVLSLTTFQLSFQIVPYKPTEVCPCN